MVEGGEVLSVGERGHAVAAGAMPAALPPQAVPPMHARLGEELPVFCERCGYSLHGLPQIRCGACHVLHFSCPECDHHQPINTLRPAVQRALGRLRALGLAGIVFLKLNFFFWILFAWGAFGTEMAYRYNYNYQGFQASGQPERIPAPFHPWAAAFVFVWSCAFVSVGRMLLLRWRSGLAVGLVLGGLIVLALTLGAHLQMWAYNGRPGPPVPSPMAPAFTTYLACALAGAVVGATCVWGVWLALAHAFLPRRAAVALIEWQRAMSARDARGGQADAATSVTA
jgi:hypothetical protein